MVKDDQRAQAIRIALEGVADELLALPPDRSGSVTLHFQNAVPMRVEWRILARPVKRGG